MCPLNEPQRNSIRAAVRVLHQKMADLEGILASGSRPSALARHVPDLSPAEVRVIRDYFARIREVMLADLEGEGIAPDARKTSLRWAVRCGVTSLSILVDEMGPRRLGNYGPLDEQGRRFATTLQEDVGRLVDRLAAFVREGQGGDLAGRLARLGRGAGGAEELRRIERIVARRHLVEFRPRLAMILDRLESPSFEVAVFGRVSSGKSSLLNHIAGRDVLPVGVTPVTAVPTRLVGGSPASATVSFAELPSRSIPLEALRDYASEEGNPGNERHVTGIVVTIPSPRLEPGVVLVDTPGIGSLAIEGGAEALAYLPRADLGVVLVDAASTLTDEDLSLLRALYAAGIPPMLLLSKADLLSEGDRARAVRYVEETVRRELQVEIPAHPVSIVGPGEALMLRWFEEQLRPLFARHRGLVEESLRRKVGSLRESVAAALELLLARSGGAAPPEGAVDAASAKRLLDEADAAIRAARGRLDGWREGRGALVDAALAAAADALATAPGDPGPALARAVEAVLRGRAREAHALVLGLRDAIGGVARDEGIPPGGDPESAGWAIGGLPAPDAGRLASLDPPRVPPWARRIPRVARWWAARIVARRLEAEIERIVDAYDRHVGSWIGERLSGLVAVYEGRAEALRERGRRRSAGGGGPGEAGDREELERDIAELIGPAPVGDPDAAGIGPGPVSEAGAVP